MVNTLSLSGIEAGEYEWKVEAICSGSASESELFTFSNDALGGCNQAFNLEATNITD